MATYLDKLAQLQQRNVPVVRPSDPLLSFQFAVEVAMVESPGVPIIGYFTELTGIEMDMEVVEYRATASFTGKYLYSIMPGIDGYATLTLKRGITTDLGFWKWYELSMNRQIKKARAKVTVTMFNRSYGRGFSKTEIEAKELDSLSDFSARTSSIGDAVWEFSDCWAQKLSGPELRTDSSDVAIEELAIVYTGFTRK